MKRTQTALLTLTFSGMIALLAPAGTASAQCVAPNLTVDNVVCALGQNCDVAIDLDTNSEDFAAASATMTSPGTIACQTPCAVGSAASGNCFINTDTCAWNVTDFGLNPFSDGEAAVVTIQCNELGVFDLDLSAASLGRPNGQPEASCGISGSVDCRECLSDGDCSGGQLCDGSGSCVECLDAGDCIDGEACTEDSCNAGSCVNDAAAMNGESCNDGLFCTATDTCSGGSCVGSGDPCNGGDCADTCNEAGDTCFDTAGTGCSDGDLCTESDQCNGSGSCIGSNVDCSHLDGNCALGQCNASNGSCFADPLAATTPCSDGAFCNGLETCDGAGTCTAGTAPNCNDGVSCTDDSCNEAGDACDNIANNANCDDGAFCNGAETCNAVSDCQAGTAPDCDDGVGCTDDACNETGDTCDNVANNANCDDGAFCNGTETCNAVSDCQAGTAPDCDDGVGCTDDSCNETGDTCDNIVNNANCDDGAFCNGAETCDAALDCQTGSAPDCDDGVGCTDDSCNESTDSCDNGPNDANCDDGAFCNGAETCDAVSDCMPGQFPCSDAVACTVDGCHEPSDACTNDPSDARCDDGLTCNGAESCDAIAGCMSELPVDCAHLDDECNFGICSDENSGCTAEPLADGTACEDGNACTLDDECLTGTCIRTTFCGVPVSRGDEPLVSDALFALRAGVLLEICALCECDVNADGRITVLDALTILQATVGIEVGLDCFEAVDEALTTADGSAQ